MNLKAYLAESNMTMKSFADLLGINQRYMSRIMNGHIKPGKRLERDIHTLTEGKVALELKEKQQTV